MYVKKQYKATIGVLLLFSSFCMLPVYTENPVADNPASIEPSMDVNSNVAHMPKPTTIPQLDVEPGDFIDPSVDVLEFDVNTSHPVMEFIGTQSDFIFSDIEVADLNGDGIDDFVLVEQTRVLFIDGDTKETMYAYEEGFFMFRKGVMADFNNDGTKDIALGTIGSDPARVVVLDGSNGTLIKGVNLNALPGDIDRHTVEEIGVGNFNDDGIPDVMVIVDEKVQLIDIDAEVVLHQYGDINGRAFAIGEFTGDSIDDVVIAQSVGSYLYLIDGDTGLEVDSYPLLNSGAYTLDIADFDGDNEPDIVVGDWSGTIHFIRGTDLSQLYTFYVATERPQTKSIEILEITGDNTPDVILGTGYGTIFALNGTDGKMIYNNSDSTSEVFDIVSGDYNNDSVLDIAVASDQSLVRVLDSTTGELIFSRETFTDPLSKLINNDVNDDGVIDIAGLGSNLGNFYIWVSDVYDPILKSMRLPAVRSSGNNLDFIVEFDEPNIDSVSLYYLIEGTIEQLSTSNPGSNLVNFLIPSTSEQVLEFWLEANDTLGNLASQGSAGNTYKMPIIQERVWESDNFGSSKIYDFKLADFNQDDIMDIVAASKDGSVYFIDGETGELMYDNFELKYSVGQSSSMDIGDFTGDGVPDVVVTGEWLPDDVIFINGSDGTNLFTANIGPNLSKLVVGEFTGDTTPDVFGVANNDIRVINGLNGQDVYGMNAPEGMVNAENIISADFNGDGQDDIAIITQGNTDSGRVFFFDGSDLSQMFEYIDLEQYDTDHPQFAKLLADDVTGDGIDDLIVGTRYLYDPGHVIIIDPAMEGVYHSFEVNGTVTGLATSTIGNDQVGDIGVVVKEVAGFNTENTLYVIDVLNNQTLQEIVLSDAVGADVLITGKLYMADYSSDGIADFVVQTGTGIYVINSVTGLLFDTLTDDSQEIDVEISTFVLYDLNQNGILDVVYPVESSLRVAQGLKQVQTLIINTETPEFIRQTGITSQFKVNVVDFYDNPVGDALVSIVAAKSIGEDRQTLTATSLGNGSYVVNLKPESFLIGEYQIITLVDHPSYTNIKLSDYQASDGSFSSADKFSVIGEIKPIYRLDSEGASFTEETGIIENVVEGNNVTLRITLRDRFDHALTTEEVIVMVEFNGVNYTASYPDSDSIAEFVLNTTGIRYNIEGIPLTIYYEGEFMETEPDTSSLKIQIVPQKPGPMFRGQGYIMPIVLLVSLLFFSFVMKELNDIYRSLGTDPGEMYSSIRRALVAMLILFVGIMSLGFLTALVSPLTSFVILLSSLLVALILVLIVHFRITVKQYYALEFKTKPLTISLVMSFTVGLILAGVVFFGQRVEWISYHMAIDTMDILFIKDIPSIIWDVAVTGFLTGFLYILVLDTIDTYSDIKNLNEINAKVLDGYYPKEPNKLYSEITVEAKKTLISLSKGFLLWYVVILWSVINNLELLGIVDGPLLAFFAPVIFALIIFFRKQIMALVGLDLREEDEARVEKDKPETNEEEISEKVADEVDDILDIDIE